MLAATLLEAGATEEAAAVAGRGWEAVSGHGAEGYQLLTLGPLAAATVDPDVLDRARSMVGDDPDAPRACLGARRGRIPDHRPRRGRGGGCRCAAPPTCWHRSPPRRRPERWPTVHDAVAALGGRLRTGR